MKILLCLLSDQHVPNLLSVHHYKPEQLVLVETAQMESRGVASHFLTALKLGGLNYDEHHHVQPLDAEDRLDAVRQALQVAYGRYPSGQWIANLTGGTKPMSIATYEFFKALGGKLVYTNVSRPAQIIDMNTHLIEDCGHRLGIKEFLAGYGFESRKADDKLAEAEQRARGWAQSAKLLAEHGCETDVLVLDDQERRRARDKGIELPDVRLGLEVGRQGDTSGNDFDVAFMHNHGLSMVECKSGSQDHDPGSDILYKVEAVTRQFRALRVRSYLATTGRNVFDANGKLKTSVKNRASIYNCRIVTGTDIKQIANGDDTPDAIRKLLFNAMEPR